jgi:hypothetical protein
MKQIIIAVVVLLISATTFAQQEKTVEQHLLDAFPKEMPEYVRQNSKIIPVNKKLQKEQYRFFNRDTSFIGSLRLGDTVLIYNNQPWFTMVKRYMVEPVTNTVPVVKVVKVKQPKQPRQRRPMNPQTQQAILQVGSQLTNQIFWQMRQRGW